jgi:hypothetical protein
VLSCKSRRRRRMSAFLELSRAWGETYRSECKYDAQFTACSIDSTNTGIFLQAVSYTISESILQREDAKRTHLQPGLFKTLTSCFTVCSKTCAGVMSICVISTISWYRGGRIGSCLPLSHRSVRSEKVISFGSCEDVSDQ